MFSTDMSGKQIDHHLHPETDWHRREFSRMAVERAKKEGMSHEMAMKLFGNSLKSKNGG